MSNSRYIIEAEKTILHPFENQDSARWTPRLPTKVNMEHASYFWKNLEIYGFPSIFHFCHDFGLLHFLELLLKPLILGGTLC